MASSRPQGYRADLQQRAVVPAWRVWAAGALLLGWPPSGWGQGTPTQENPLRLPSEVRTARVHSSAVTRGFQPVPGGGAAAQQELTLEQVQRRRQQVQDDGALDQATKTELLKYYAQAEDWLQRAAELDQRMADWKTEVQQAPQAVQAIQAQLAQPLLEPEPPFALDAPLSELDQAVAQAQEQLKSLRAELAAWEANLKTRERKTEAGKHSEELTRQLEDARSQLTAAPAAGENPLVTQARRVEAEAHVLACARQLEASRAEANRLDSLTELNTLRRDLAQRLVAHQEKLVADWQKTVTSRRQAEADQQVQEAQRQWKNADPALEELGTRAAALARERKQLAAELADLAMKAETQTKTLDALQRAEERTVEKVNASGLSSTIGLMLRKQHDQLPDIAGLQDTLRYIETKMPQVQLHAIELKEDRAEIGDLEASVQGLRRELSQALSDEEWRTIEPLVRESLERQREALDALRRDHDAYLDALTDLEVYTRQLLDQVRRFGDYIDERILWIRSSERLRLSDLPAAVQGLLSVLSPQRWLRALVAVCASPQPPLFSAGAMLLAWGALFLSRRRLRERLQHLVRPPGDSLFHNISVTFEALLVTVAIASLWPLLVWFCGWTLAQVAAHPEFSHVTADVRTADLIAALALALKSTAGVFWPAEIVRQVLRSQGVAEAHLGWDPTMARLVREAVRRLMLVGLPFLPLVTLFEVVDEAHWRDSLGRLTFISGLLLLSGTSYVLFQPQGAIFQSIFHGGSGRWSHRLRYCFFAVATLAPVALAILAAAGYQYSASQLAARLLQSLWFVLTVLFCRSLIARWFFLRQWELARRLAEQRAVQDAAVATPALPPAAKPAETAAAETSSGGLREEQDQALVTIDLQLQQLLRIAVASALLIGLWIIWEDVLPALRALDRIVIWSAEAKATAAAAMPGSSAPAAPASALPVLSPPATSGTSLGDVLRTLLIAIITILAGKNLPGLLEVVLLERLPMDKGARSAFTTICGYGIMLAGFVVGANAIGLRWQSIQWLAAALTVGLGFGLQEIFANFVSGLILLFERPIRVGDVITLGEITGTVTRIRIRATTITDWDCKELIVPNKELITGHLLNWTLSDQRNRVVIQVGVAYGSDTAKVTRVLLDIARHHPRVLQDPEPTVTFESFGDSTLNFTLRGLLPNLDKRLPTIHELNTAIHQRFAREGIELAFPQLDLHVRSLPHSGAPAAVGPAS